VPEIKHDLVIRAPAPVVYSALSERRGLAGWWTAECTAESFVGGTATFTFGDRYHNVMRITALDPGRRVCWRCEAGDPEWVGTTFEFALEARGDQTVLGFTHAGWREATDFMASCNSQWGHYLRSLKALCETGRGDPFGQ
jgi:uncharacterized protein YndB with AHSA1/START domain